MKKVDVYIICRQTFCVKSYNQCFEFDIARDYIGSEKSTFRLYGSWTAEEGDFFIVKTPGDTVLSADRIVPFYTGIVNEFDGDTISTLESYNIFNFDFAALRMTGNSFEQNLLDLINANFFAYPVDYENSYIVVEKGDTNTSYSYQPSEPPTPTNFIEYMINGFEKYNITIECDYIQISQVGENQYTVHFTIRQKSNKIQLKNNVYTFVNWNVYENENSLGMYNKLLIIDKASTNPINPTILSTYYLEKDGGLTQSINDNVFKPVRNKIFIYDQTEDNPPTFLSVAQSELAGKNYSHEIIFDLVQNNNFLTIGDLDIGLLVDIFYNKTIYQSVLTAYRVQSTNVFINLTFGNIRSTLKTILDNRYSKGD